MMLGNGHLSVPPGFRFHPTDEELLYYYLRKKVAYEAIDLDVIRDVDLNKLEPWDLKDRCRIGSGPQTESYFFSHKDKKYPTGTRTNRATTAGFWKATGRDKAIHSNSRRIGMRKTLVFYTGRAPHGQKTDWIMHEYRLDDDNIVDVQEDGWVVCRVFMKKNHQTALQAESSTVEEGHQFKHINQSGPSPSDHRKYNFHMHYDPALDNSMHLPQLLSTESIATPPFLQSVSLSAMDVQCSQNLMRLTTSSPSPGGGGIMQEERFNGDWSFLDRLLASHHCLEQLSSVQRFPFQYLGGGADFLKFSK